MDTLLRYYKGSFLLFFAGIVAAYFLGGMQAVFIILILCILEISLSFDNAVVNATVLEDMTEVWRRRFLTWGILIAVFGMRIIFPVVIVSIVSGLSPWAALNVAVNDPDAYAAYMTSAHVSIMAFGGAFLMMVGLSFFFDGTCHGSKAQRFQQLKNIINETYDEFKTDERIQYLKIVHFTKPNKFDVITCTAAKARHCLPVILKVCVRHSTNSQRDCHRVRAFQLLFRIYSVVMESGAILSSHDADLLM